MAFQRAQSSLEITLNHEYITDPVHIPRVRAEIAKHIMFEFDTETTGLSFLDDNILLYQIGTPNKQFVVDARTVPIHAFKDYLESEDMIKILHNAKFDYLMCKAAGITMERMADTQLAECCLTAGIMVQGRDLEACMLRHFGYSLDKTLQKSFIGMTMDMRFSKEQIAYAAMDVAILRRLLESQTDLLRKHGLLPTAKLEYAAVPVFGDMEFFGMHLNQDLWLSNLDKGAIELRGITQEMNAIALSTGFLDTDMGGLLHFYKTTAKGKIEKVYFNWASSSHTMWLFNKIWPRKHEDDPLLIPSTGNDVLVELHRKYRHPLIKLLMTHRGLSKQTGTYGMSYINHVHPKTGKFHPEFNQYGTDTGRPSGKKPNMLNIPRKKEYRHSFCAPPECDWHTRDYSGCELRIIASMSGDPAMCKAYIEGKDLHSYVASKFMNLDYDDFVAAVRAEDPKAKEIRQACKSLNFGIIYGMGPTQLAADLNLDIAVARQYYYGYRKEFHVMVSYLEKLSAAAVDNGYATTSLGRKKFFRKPTYPVHTLQGYRTHAHMKETLFAYATRTLPNYRGYKASVDDGAVAISFKEWVKGGDIAVTPEIAKFFFESSAIQRESGNHPVQGGNADITKHAMVNIRKRLQRGGYYPRAHMVLQVYDEICMCAPTAWRSEMSAIMEEEMVRAGSLVIKGIPVLMDAHIGPTWTK